MPATWELLDICTAQRKRLLSAGYLPLPVCGKAPAIAGWTDIKATDDIIDSWATVYPSAQNTGILTRTTPCVDVDVLDTEVATEVEALLWDVIGTRALVRFGKAPKRAMPFRCTMSFKKVSTPVFTAPGGTGNRVEILGHGQQLVAFGTHPDTNKPYSWHGGEPGNITRADLPELTEALAQQFIREAASIMRAAGWAEGANGHAVSDFEKVYGPDWSALVQAGIGEGGRNDTIARLAGHLLQRHVDPLMTLELILAFNEARCRPPLDRAEVVRTVDSIAGAELRQRGTR
jgi:hypothetical protein